MKQIQPQQITPQQYLKKIFFLWHNIFVLKIEV